MPSAKKVSLQVVRAGPPCSTTLARCPQAEHHVAAEVHNTRFRAHLRMLTTARATPVILICLLSYLLPAAGLPLSFDHGTQLFLATTPAFLEEVASWAAAGAAAQWHGRSGRITPGEAVGMSGCCWWEVLGLLARVGGPAGHHWHWGHQPGCIGTTCCTTARAEAGKGNAPLVRTSVCRLLDRRKLPPLHDPPLHKGPTA